MRYRLDELSSICIEQGVDHTRIDEHRLDVELSPGCVLSFCNLIAEDDTLIGFEGMPWHCHGHPTFFTSGSTYFACDEVELLIGLLTGELLVVSQLLNRELKDRWIVHRKEPLDCNHLEAGEELRVLCRAL